MKNKNLIYLIPLLLVAASPVVGFCSVESSLMAVQSRLMGTILPLLAALGLVLSGISFALGSPNAKSHLMYAIIGAIVGFGSTSIINWIQGVIQ